MTDAALLGSGRFRYRPQASWAMVPPELAFQEAVAVACDSEDRVFVFTRVPHQVLVFAADGKFLMVWGQELFARPHGLFIGPDDTIYCTDDFGHAVHAFTRDGTLRFTLGKGQPSDTGATSIDYRTIRRSAGPFHYPTNLALGPTGDLYVSDGYGNARVHRFSRDGGLLASWGEPGAGLGQFHVPHGIAVDADGTVLVADRENSRIQRFTASGEYLDEWTDVARPCQVFLDRDGWVYVAELGFRAGRWPGTGEAEPGATGGRVSIFDRQGKLHARWGGGDNPCAPGDFFAPHGIWVDRRGDIYVTEVIWSGGAASGKVTPTCHSLQKFVRLDP